MKYILIATLILLSISAALNFYWYRERLNTSSQDNYELKHYITELRSTIDSLRLFKTTNDTVYTKEIQTITNNFNHIYETIDTTNDYLPLIEYLLSRHRQTPVERDYKVPGGRIGGQTDTTSQEPATQIQGQLDNQLEENRLVEQAERLITTGINQGSRGGQGRVQQAVQQDRGQDQEKERVDTDTCRNSFVGRDFNFE